MPNKNSKKYNEYMNEYLLKKYINRRTNLINQLGGCCNNCGAKDNLEFHHIEKRNFWIGKKLHTINNDKLQTEIKKYILLCSACHKMITIKEKGFNKKDQHGTLICYRHNKCRCDSCKAAKAKYNKQQRTYSSVGRATDFNRSALKETLEVEPRKFGKLPQIMLETMPSQALIREGVETRHEASKVERP